MALLEFVAALVVLGVLVGLMQRSLAAWVILIAAAIWSAYMVVRGGLLRNRPAPLNLLARQYTIAGASRLVAVGLQVLYLWMRSPGGHLPG